ncbi:hypothetical protein B0T13DRAFT_100598 [Neurospora crassa]|nr:hypothetical protein B0T13DRAFT_100598 [Neurospora crassa]
MVNLRKSALLGFAGVGPMLSALLILRIPTIGCLYVMEKKKVSLTDCAFTVHLSMLKLPRHIHEVQLPLSLANGENDSFMRQEKMKEVMSILRDKNKAPVKEAEGVDRPIIPNAHEVVVYPGAKHGFAVRGDREDPLQKERGDQSEGQAVRWFSIWVATRGSQGCCQRWPKRPEFFR